MNKPIKLTQQQKDNIEALQFLDPQQKIRLANAIRNHSYQMDDKLNREIDVYLRHCPRDNEVITQELRIAVAGVFRAIPMFIADVLSWSPKYKEEQAYIDGKIKTLD
jgi:CHASE3 domain sensor protein